MKDITRIVLTGGPCGGKTTALEHIIKYFSDKGYKVFAIPELASLFTKAGMNYLTTNKEYFWEGEIATMKVQLTLEDHFYRMAKAYGKPCIIVCDRGALDISAYMNPEAWQELVAEFDMTDTKLALDRYEGVVHLVTAADGAEHAYTTSNNAQRYEKADEEGLKVARMLDANVIRAWSIHPNHFIIDNSTDFDGKLQRTIQAIETCLHG